MKSKLERKREIFLVARRSKRKPRESRQFGLPAKNKKRLQVFGNVGWSPCIPEVQKQVHGEGKDAAKPFCQLLFMAFGITGPNTCVPVHAADTPCLGLLEARLGKLSFCCRRRRQK